jgi:hypothetical protein
VERRTPDGIRTRQFSIGMSGRLRNRSACDVRPRSSLIPGEFEEVSVLFLMVGQDCGANALASGEKVSQGPLEPLFQVRILARQPRPIRARARWIAGCQIESPR